MYQSKLATIAHRAHGDHPKIFVAYFHGVDLILGGFNSIDLLVILKLYRFYWTSFTLFCLMATLKPRKFVLCCLGIFDGPIYCCFEKRLYLVVLSDRIISPALSLKLVCCSHYLF